MVLFNNISSNLCKTVKVNYYVKEINIKIIKQKIIIIRAEKSRDLPVQECGSDCVDTTAYGLLRHVNYLKESER